MRSGCRRSRGHRRCASTATSLVLAVPSTLVQGSHRDPLPRLVEAPLAEIGEPRASTSCIEVPPTAVRPSVDPSTDDVSSSSDGPPQSGATDDRPADGGGSATTRPSRRRRRPRSVNPRYTFEAFVTGTVEPLRPRRRPGGRRDARPRPTTRCSSTATPGSARPTCCTPSATTSRENYPAYQVRYVSTETFLNEFVDAIRTQRHGRVQAALPRDRRAARRRHPVHGGQGGPPGGVLPHLQRRSTRPTGRSCSPRIARPTPSRPSRTGSAAASRWA